MQHELENVFAWLESGEAADYQTGVLLLQKHSRNRSLVGLLLKKESMANREKLVYELIKIGCGGRMEDVSEVVNHFAQAVQGAVQQVASVPQEGAGASACYWFQSQLQQLVEVPHPESGQDFSQRPDPDQVPDELRPQLDDLTERMSRAYSQRCQLSNSLATLDPADGPRVVSEILTLEQQYNVLAQQRRDVLAGQQEPATPAAATSEAPVAEPLPGVDRADLLTRRNTLRSNISKAKKKAEESKTEDKRSEYAQKAGRLQVELDQVEMQLKA